MDEKNLSSMTDAEFEALLEDNLPPQPPDAVAHDVTPWRKALQYILVGMALTTVTFQVLYLQYILPFAGILLMLLGFRTLRQENIWFKACFLLTAVRTAFTIGLCIVNASIVQNILYDWDAKLPLLTIGNIALLFALFLCFRQALLTVQDQVGLPRHAGGVTALPVWYGILSLLALAALGGWLLSIPMLIAYGFMLHALVKISREVANAGYAVHPTAPRLSNRNLVLLLTSIVLVGIFCASFFGSKYSMEWMERDPAERADVSAIKEELLSKGFPEYVLHDMTAEDIAACEGAVRIFARHQDLPINPGHEEARIEGNTTCLYTAYDAEELRLTQIGVLLPGEQQRWQIIHHFSFTEDPGFCGTECIKLSPAYQNPDMGWQGNDKNLSGRVLYTDKDGREYVSPYFFLGPQTYIKDSPLFGVSRNHDLFAAFSFPRGDKQQRGYLCYPMEALGSSGTIDASIFYTHQYTLRNYPAKTAMEHCMSGRSFHTPPFLTAHDALQLFPCHGEYGCFEGNGIPVLS